MTADDRPSRLQKGPPLSGVRVLVTRPAREDDAEDPLAEQLRALGAEVIRRPAIRIAPPSDWRHVDEAKRRLDRYDWLVFSSANGVRMLLDRWGEATRLPRLAAIGPGTAEELARRGLHADVVPAQFRAESLADALAADAKGKRFLLARANRGREALAERLLAAGAEVDQIVVYQNLDVDRPEADVTAMVRAGRIDWATVTSSTIARSLHRLFGDDLRRLRLASISPVTSGALRALGHEPSAEAAEYTFAGLAAAIAREVEAERSPGRFGP